MKEQLDYELQRLQWTYESPRITAFLQESSIKLKRPISSPLELPPKYIKHLTHLLQTYSECIKDMQVLKIDWNDQMIQDVFKKYGYGNRLPLKGWKELSAELKEGIPF